MQNERILILDTETTGLNFESDKIIEIGIVELKDNVLTQNCFHEYINPEKEISISAQKIHGISNQFLTDKPKFSQIAQKFLDFIKDDIIVIHNSEFDTSFINKELQNCGFNILENFIIDTVKIARKEFPGQTVNLDSLCRKLTIINTRQDYHGALLDATLLAKVYLRLTTGKQENLNLIDLKTVKLDSNTDSSTLKDEFLKPRDWLMRIADHEIKEHNNFIKEMKNSIWKNK